MSTHEPLLFNDDNEPIGGLKRCKNCGLSETYWERWPVCESKSQAKRIAARMAGPAKKKARRR